jgi:hypothetical protein
MRDKPNLYWVVQCLAATSLSEIQAYPLFTMCRSTTKHGVFGTGTFQPIAACAMGNKIGGASRDRTDDLKLAKLPLSQLSYGPNFPD